MIKDLEFLFKKVFFSESYLLKKRIKRAIKKGYEKELLIISSLDHKVTALVALKITIEVHSPIFSNNGTRTVTQIKKIPND